VSDQRFEAKEKTVMKMSRDGLYEESLGSGESRLISGQTDASENIQMTSDPPASGSIRKPEDLFYDRRTTYAESTKESYSAESPPSQSRFHRYTSYGKQAGRTWETRIDLPKAAAEGGEHQNERSSDEAGHRRKSRQRKQSEQFRKAEAGETGRDVPQEKVSSEDSGDEGAEETEEAVITDHSSRMRGVSSLSSFLSDKPLKTGLELRHDRNKKQVQKYSLDERQKKQRLEDIASDYGSLSERKEDIAKRQKKEHYNQEQRKQAAEAGVNRAGRLHFEEEELDGSMVRGSGIGFGRIAEGAIGAATGAITFAVHSKVNEAEDDNAGVEAAHSAERLTEETVRSTANKRALRPSGIVRGTPEATSLHRLYFGEEPGKAAATAKQEAEKNAFKRKAFQKQRYRRMYAAAKKEEKSVEQAYKASQSFVTKAAAVVKETIRRNSKVFLILGVLGMMFFLMAATITSCTAVIHGTGSSVISTTYASTDTQIHRVENEYRKLESSLNAQINSISSRYPDYDEFRYQIDEISHNPYHLISYFTVKYGEFTYSKVRAELEEIFREQYEISTESDTITTTHTKSVRVGGSLGRVITSGYCSCPICCGQWSGGPTASGVYPTANHTIAVDANNPFVPMGTHVVMNGVEYVVEDTGAFARYGVQFDVYYDNHSTALSHGHQSWEAFVADSNGSNVVQVTSTETVKRLSVTLTNHDLDTVLRSRMTANEIKRYEVYNKTYGNRNYLFDLNTLPQYGPFNSYTIPPDALSDERFARMIHEAEKYLGYPYVWGGSSPSTSFDCSGFVSWVVNNCGNGWNYGRLTAEGLRQVTAYVSPESAMPGDLIFFQGTYDCAGASHCGIYVGDGMMIHCGNPIQYTSINSSYWQDHFYQFGRLP